MDFQVSNANIKTNYDWDDRKSLLMIKEIINKQGEINKQLSQEGLIIRGSVNESGPTLAKVPFYAFRRSMDDLYWTTILFNVVSKNVYLSIQHKTDNFSALEKNSMTTFASDLVMNSISGNYKKASRKLFSNVANSGRPINYGKHSVIYLDITNFDNQEIISQINKFISIADVLNGKKNIAKDDEELNRLEADIKAGERFVIAKARIGHEAWKKKLKKKYGTQCAICEIDLDELLIASHVKPWSKSNSKEKVDLHNGLLLCPNHDKLFDRRLISFDINGEIIISKKLKKVEHLLDILDKKVNEKYYKQGTYDKIFEYMKEHKIER